MMSRQEMPVPKIVNSGARNAIKAVSVNSKARRKSSASDRPIWRARSASLGEQRATRTEMNTRLSMPSTISSVVSVTSAAHACGSVSSSSMRHASGEPPQHAGGSEIKPDCEQRRGDPAGRVQVLQQRHHREDRPDSRYREREAAPALDPHRVDERKGNEG